MARQVLVPWGLPEIATPATPSAGTVLLYAKSDHKAYTKDSSGAEVDLTATGGGGGGALQTKTANYTAVSTDAYVLADATSAAFTVTLPAVASGRVLTIKKIDGTANYITVAPASGVIDGGATDTLTMQYQARTYVSDGTNWFRV